MPSQRLKRPLRRKGPHFVYIVECSDKTYYTGYTNDLQRRLARHNSGKGAKYLRGRLPVRLVYAKKYRCFRHALRAENVIKRLDRSGKEKLVMEAGR